MDIAGNSNHFSMSYHITVPLIPGGITVSDMILGYMVLQLSGEMRAEPWASIDGGEGEEQLPESVIEYFQCGVPGDVFLLDADLSVREQGSPT